MVVKMYQKADYAIFEETCRVTKLQPKELAELLGYSGQTPADWKREGSIPKVAAIACQTIENDHHGPGPAADCVIVAKPGEKVAALKSVLLAMDIPFTEL